MLHSEHCISELPLTVGIKHAMVDAVTIGISCFLVLIGPCLKNICSIYMSCSCSLMEAMFGCSMLGPVFFVFFWEEGGLLCSLRKPIFLKSLQCSYSVPCMPVFLSGGPFFCLGS